MGDKKKCKLCKIISNFTKLSWRKNICWNTKNNCLLLRILC